MKKNLKGIMGVLLSAMLFAGTAAASPVMAGTSADILVKSVENAPDGAVTYIYGDVDLNNKLEAVDALAILKHVVKLATLDGELVLELADADHDTSITAADALAVLKCVVGLQTPSYYTVTPPASETPPETPTPDVTETPTPSDPAETVVPTATPDVTVQPTETAAPTATPKPTESAEPTATPDMTVEPTDTPAPTETPVPTVTPTETPAPHVHNYTSEVTLEATCGKDGVETFTCECGDTFTKPIPATGEHTYEKTYKTVTVVDEEAQYHVKTPHTVWVCVCGEEFHSSKGATVKDLGAHQSATWDEIKYHTNRFALDSADHIAAGYECTYNSETYMYNCTCGWSHYTGCGFSSSYIEYTYEDIPAVTHEETAIICVCSVCGETKEYEYSGDTDTCTHEWYVEREAWSEDVEECHFFCACGYDCGLYDEHHKFSSEENADVAAAFDAHIEQYDSDTILAEHNNSDYRTITVTYHHDATYRCALCGKHKESE